MKNIHELRDILCEDIDKLRAGKTTAANLNAVVNATGKVLSSVKLEMEYSKHTGKKADLKFLESK